MTMADLRIAVLVPCYNEEGTLAIAYMPTTRTVTVDLSTLAGPVSASWYDPSRGTYVAVEGSPFGSSPTSMPTSMCWSMAMRPMTRQARPA